MLLFGGCVVIPVLTVASCVAVIAHKKGKLSRLALGFILVGMWLPASVPIASELHWMLVEEPRRIAAGLPIE